MVRDQRQKRSRALGLLARLPNRRSTHLALVGQFLFIVKLKDHDIRAPILGMGRVVAIYRRIPVLAKATTNRHDLARTVLLAPLLNQGAGSASPTLASGDNPVRSLWIIAQITTNLAH